MCLNQLFAVRPSTFVRLMPLKQKETITMVKKIINNKVKKFLLNFIIALYKLVIILNKYFIISKNIYQN